MIGAPPPGVVAAVLAAGVAGWSVAGYPGAAVGSALGVAAGLGTVRGRPPWSWLVLWLRRGRKIVLADPVPVANDRSGGGVRCQDGVAAVAVQLLGTAHTPTLFTGSAGTRTDNTVDLADLRPLLRHSLGLTADSLSVVSVGARRRSTGDYARVYDTLIGTPPYAGQRETWLVVRIGWLVNSEALQHRASAATAALATGQRIAAALRQQGVRARVASAADIVELDRRLGAPALALANRRWRSLRGPAGWWTTYAYRPADLNAASLAQAWTIPADRIVQNLTLLPDATVTATVTVLSPQPATAPPSVLLRTLPGQQAGALMSNLCGPRPGLSGIGRARPAGPLVVPVGPSGVLLGKAAGGTRLLLPLTDPGEVSRVLVDAEDVLAKRIVVRLAASGERITVHSTDVQRWAGVRMPDVVLSDRARPAPGSTVSVTDGTVLPAPRPATVIYVGAPGAVLREPADVLITQTGPALLQVTAGGQVHPVQMELFRAENRYVRAPAAALDAAG